MADLQLADYTLRRGHAGQEVRRLQRRLNISADGVFGGQTEAAVRAYQQKATGAPPLLVTGVADRDSLARLGLEVLQGIDISGHQRQLDVDAVARAGVRFCWVKATEDDTYTYARHQERMRALRAGGIAVGGYHFARPETKALQFGLKDGIREAHHFLRALDWQDGDMPPALDVEKGLGRKWLLWGRPKRVQHNVQWCLAWLRTVERELGVRPLVYTARWAVNAYFRGAQDGLLELATYPLWWADYQSMGGRGVEPKDAWAPWGEWAAWQWTGKGYVPGIGKCDRNWMPATTLARLTGRQLPLAA